MGKAASMIIAAGITSLYGVTVSPLVLDLYANAAAVLAIVASR